MGTLFSQIGAADPFTSGAWMLYWFSALGVVVAGWILIRKVQNLVVKSVFMALVVFLCTAMAEITFETGAVVWVPAIPFLGVDLAFKEMKYIDQIMPYLVVCAAGSLVLCTLIAVSGRKILSRSKMQNSTNKQDSTKKQPEK